VTRDVTVTAGGFLALNEFANGRCLLGIGVGGSAVHTVGLREDGARDFRDKLGVLAALVRGDAIQRAGATVRGRIAAPAVPIYVASSSPRVLEIAGEVADGVILNVGVLPELIQEGLQHVARGARRAGREATDLDIVVIAGCSINADRSRAIEEARSWAATTARRIATWMIAGGEDVRRVGATILEQYDWAEHIAAGAAHARPVSDAMARSLVLAGTADDVSRTIEDLARCGVTQVVPLLMGASIDATLEVFGRDIIPAWRAPAAARSSA
jgi:alkanesulfonate monooxygenase SsuD/methylene tetrahydromethanopterin reductase-like flavin-dependent oxidoreductase (luciferase family)